MKNLQKIFLLSVFLLSCFGSYAQDKFLKISGVYPHLAVYNPWDKGEQSGGGECGIGAVVPWAGKLWLVTYSPHMPHGSADRLWLIDSTLNISDHPKSIGGTPANRLIHRESQQLIIGPYFIDKEEHVRAIPYSQMPGRHTATARHLTEPERLVYFQGMEGELYEVDVYSLESRLLFKKPVPGWHGKGGYTGQGHYITSNNGEHKVFDIPQDLLQAGGAPKNDEEMGCLAEWDGENWRIVERKQFTEVTGPGGIYGNHQESDPVWSMGWDKRSVILKLRDGGHWYSYRLPKATKTYDHWGGWYTEWPRIREIGKTGHLLADMHGLFYDFPKHFSRNNSSGLKPISTHLRYIPDFCYWKGELVLATDETSIIQNPMAGRSMSNLWFGQAEELKNWGPNYAFGGPWLDDMVKADQPSDPFLLKGFEQIVLHLSLTADEAVQVSIETDIKGNNQWQHYRSLTISSEVDSSFIFPDGFDCQWVRLNTDKPCRISAMFYLSEKDRQIVETDLFDGLANINDPKPCQYGIIRPSNHNLNLQFVSYQKEKEVYYEADEQLKIAPSVNSPEELHKHCSLQTDFKVDKSSVIVEQEGLRVRLPKSDLRYDSLFEAHPPRGIRELESERYMMNIHGTFYEMPREAGLNFLRPVATHHKKIMDFCTWRGLLVIAGVSTEATADGHVHKSSDAKTALWFGGIDDLWQLGKVTGQGGPWKDSPVEAGVYSDRYLMNGYDRKHLLLKADKDVNIQIEVDINADNWMLFKTVSLKAGESFEYDFPAAYHAQWIRFKADRDCIATAWLTYR